MSLNFVPRYYAVIPFPFSIQFLRAYPSTTLSNALIDDIFALVQMDGTGLQLLLPTFLVFISEYCVLNQHKEVENSH